MADSIFINYLDPYIDPTITDSQLFWMSLYNLAIGLTVGYHGYKRHHDSYLWGLGWMLLPNLIEFPITQYASRTIALNASISTIPLIVASYQGFAEPIKRSA